MEISEKERATREGAESATEKRRRLAMDKSSTNFKFIDEIDTFMQMTLC